MIDFLRDQDTQEPDDTTIARRLLQRAREIEEVSEAEDIFEAAEHLPLVYRYFFLKEVLMTASTKLRMALYRSDVVRDFLDSNKAALSPTSTDFAADTLKLQYEDLVDQLRSETFVTRLSNDEEPLSI